MALEKWFVGVDLGGTSTKFAFIDINGKIIHKWRIKTNNRDHGKRIISNMVETINENMHHKGINKSKLYGIGIGVPGPVEYSSGIVYNTVNLGWKKNIPLKELLENKLSLPVRIENDANCAALGEMWKGSGAGAEDIVFVTLGTGVGGGVIANGRIVQGISGAAGEMGHFVCIPEGGAPCNCGKTGCLETIASATGIVRIAKERLKTCQNYKGALYRIFHTNGTITAKDVFDCGKDGDLLCIEVIREVSYYLGLALANAANILNPERILLGGGVSEAGDILLREIQVHFDRFAFSQVKGSTKISLASLGNDAGVIGAAWLIKTSIDVN